MKSLKVAIILVAAMAVCYSCGENPKNNSTSNTSSPVTNMSKDVDEKQAFINKYNVYVDVWNTVSPSIESSYALLTNNFDETGKPRKKKTVILFPKL